MQKPSKLEVALFAFLIAIAVGCFYCRPSKAGGKTENVGAPVQKIEASTKTKTTYSVTGQVGLSLEK